jgi:hypothetical protein
VFTLVFLPALYAIWFKIKPASAEESNVTALSVIGIIAPSRIAAEQLP